MTTQEATRSAEITRWVAMEALCMEWQVPFELVEDMALSDIKTTDDYSQVRLSTHRAPKENVESYALQMSNGAQFPPIVLMHNDRSVVDGNTRVAAARRAGRDSFPAYLVKPVDAKMARAIGAALNQLGGERLAAAELESVARDYMDLGFIDSEIGRRLGRTAEWARKFRKQSAFKARAGDHAAVATLKPVVQEKLSDIRLDAPFQAVLQAAQEFKIDRPMADRLVAVAEEARSEHAAVEAVVAELANLRPMLQAGKTAKPKEIVNRTRLTAIKKVNDFGEWLEKMDAPLVDPTATELLTAIDRLLTAASRVASQLRVASDAT